MSSRAVTILKFGIAGAIVAMLASSGQLRFSSMIQLFAHPATWLGLMGLQLSILMIGVLRWWLILGSLERRRMPYGELLAFNWIGQFFGCAAPSTVATDAARFTFVATNQLASRSNALMSLVVDRTAGIIGTIALAGALTGTYVFRSIAIPRAGLLAGFAIAVIIALVALRAPRESAMLRGLRDAASAIRKARVSGLIAIALAMAAMALKILSVWMIGRALLPENPSIAVVFSVAPMGFLAEALPLTPGGLGTAHLAFEYLFRRVDISGGAALFNAYFVVRLLVSLVGGLVWLGRRRRPRAAGDSVPDHAGLSHRRRLREPTSPAAHATLTVAAFAVAMNSVMMLERQAEPGLCAPPVTTCRPLERLATVASPHFGGVTGSYRPEITRVGTADTTSVP